MVVGKKHPLIAEVFSSLSDEQFICANNIKLAMLLMDLLCSAEQIF